MISYVKGEVLFSDAESICLYSNGVGWNINVADSSSYTNGEVYSVFCYTHYTQDQTSLWGLKTLEELRFFKKLLAVSGVGPRTASSLIYTKGIESICSAINEGDVSMLKVKGLGEKTIQKIIIELKGKIDLKAPAHIVLNSKSKDILDALISLGYSKNDVLEFITSKSSIINEMSEKDIIKEFLKQS